MGKIIVLMSDFGLKDTYVAQMKGVIYSIAPEARIIDLTHEIEPQNIRQAAFIVSSTYSSFPKESIFIAVVDPGVGTDRQMIAAYADNRFFVGPENGIFGFINEIDDAEIFSLENQKFWSDKVSTTFHGRDIFAHVAAHIANGVSLQELGRRLKNTDNSIIVKPVRKEDAIIGEIIWIDHFGNAISNITFNEVSQLSNSFEISILVLKHDSNREFMHVGLMQTFQDALKYKPETLFAYRGSNGFFEFAINESSASSKFNLAIGTQVRISKKKIEKWHS